MDLENKSLSYGGQWFVQLCIPSPEHGARHTVGAQWWNFMHSAPTYRDLPCTGSYVLSLPILLFPSSSTCWGSPDVARCGESPRRPPVKGQSEASPAHCVLGTKAGGSPSMGPHNPN